MIESLFLPLVAGLALASAQTTESSGPPPRPQAAPKLNSATSAMFSAEDRARLRCAAAFALVTNRTGKAAPTPELRARGQEFFVVTLAGLMDEYELDRAEIESAVRSEVGALSKSGETDQIMPACLLMLRSAGL